MIKIKKKSTHAMHKISTKREIKKCHDRNYHVSPKRSEKAMERKIKYDPIINNANIRPIDHGGPTEKFVEHCQRKPGR